MSDGLTDRRGGNEQADGYGRLPPRTAGVAAPMRPPSGAVDPFAAQRRSLEAQAEAANAARAPAFTDTVEHQLDRIADALAEEIMRVDEFNLRMIGPVPPTPQAGCAVNNGTTERLPAPTAVRRVGDRLGRVLERLAVLRAATSRLAEIG